MLAIGIVVDDATSCWNIGAYGQGTRSHCHDHGHDGATGPIVAVGLGFAHSCGCAFISGITGLFHQFASLSPSPRLFGDQRRHQRRRLAVLIFRRAGNTVHEHRREACLVDLAVAAA